MNYIYWYQYKWRKITEKYVHYVTIDVKIFLMQNNITYGLKSVLPCTTSRSNILVT